jgi:3-phenylpropionate/trans-cinnamate dioxygenase ferredoxin reductase subunit
MDGIVIIGAGECGTRAAFAAREAGYSGPITLIGKEPHLPYERPPLSKPADGLVQMKQICAAEALEATEIRYLPGVSVSAIDIASHSVRLTDDRVLQYDKLLIATGASPRHLNCVGAWYALDFRTYADADVMFSRAQGAKSAAIIGGGLIGMELAAVLCGRGIKVSIIEAAPKPLGRAVPPHFADRLHVRHMEEGVRFHLGQGVSEIQQRGAILTDGTAVPADLVVGAIGVVPDTELAQRAGISTGNGILTDMFLRTSAPDVFAAGDCSAVSQIGGGHMRFESWRNARLQGETAGRNMAGANEPFNGMPWFWSDQYDLSLQVVGLPSAGHAQVSRTIEGGDLEFYLDGGRLVAAAGLGVGNACAKDIKLAEMLVANGVSPDPTQLADPAVNLKVLLKSLRAA